MKKILSILTLLAISISGYAQMNTFGGIGLRVNDTTTYQTNAAAYHSAGYSDVYLNNQATRKHYDFWNPILGAYEHVFSLNSNYASTYPANEQTGNYTFVLADKDKVVVMRHASTSQTLTVPANVFPVGTYLTAFRDSTNTVTIAAGAGTFFENASGSLTLDDEDTPVVFWQEKLNHWQIWKGTADGGGGGGGHVIEDEGTPLTQRTNLNFTGAGVSVADSGGKTVVTITSGGGSGDVVGPASATNNVPVLFDGTTGKLVKNSTPTGSGNPVLATSPILVTPNIGTPSAGVGTNITGIVGTNVTNTPAGNIAATTSQAAINELDGEKVAIVNSATAITDASTMDIASKKNTLTTSSATRTFTISYTGDDITVVVTLNTTACTFTFPATTLCVSDGVESGNNNMAVSGVSGDKYVIAIKKVGSDYYAVAKNFGQ